MNDRFKAYNASTLEELLALMNADNTLFSTVVFFSQINNQWSAVLDFAFNPVVTPDGIEEMQERNKALSQKYLVGITA